MLFASIYRMLRFFDGRAFIAGVAVGLVFVYLAPPPAMQVVVHPTPENAGKVLYRDRAGACFRFSPREVSCPTDRGSVHRIPVQQDIL